MAKWAAYYGSQKIATFPGMEAAVAEQRAQANVHLAGELTKVFNESAGDMTAAAGEIERESPLFRDTAADPTGNLFSKGK